MESMTVREDCPMRNKKLGTKNERDNLRKKVHTTKQPKRSSPTGNKT